MNKNKTIIILALCVSVITFYCSGKFYYSGGTYRLTGNGQVPDSVIKLKDGVFYENDSKAGTYSTFFNYLTFESEDDKVKTYARVTEEGVEIEIVIKNQQYDLVGKPTLKYKKMN